MSKIPNAVWFKLTYWFNIDRISSKLKIICNMENDTSNIAKICSIIDAYIEENNLQDQIKSVKLALHLTLIWQKPTEQIDDIQISKENEYKFTWISEFIRTKIINLAKDIVQKVSPENRNINSIEILTKQYNKDYDKLNLEKEIEKLSWFLTENNCPQGAVDSLKFQFFEIYNETLNPINNFILVSKWKKYLTYSKCTENSWRSFSEHIDHAREYLEDIITKNSWVVADIQSFELIDIWDLKAPAIWIFEVLLRNRIYDCPKSTRLAIKLLWSSKEPRVAVSIDWFKDKYNQIPGHLKEKTLNAANRIKELRLRYFKKNLNYIRINKILKAYVFVFDTKYVTRKIKQFEKILNWNIEWQWTLIESLLNTEKYWKKTKELRSLIENILNYINENIENEKYYAIQELKIVINFEKLWNKETFEYELTNKNKEITSIEKLEELISELLINLWEESIINNVKFEKLDQENFSNWAKISPWEQVSSLKEKSKPEKTKWNLLFNPVEFRKQNTTLCNTVFWLADLVWYDIVKDILINIDKWSNIETIEGVNHFQLKKKLLSVKTQLEKFKLWQWNLLHLIHFISYSIDESEFWATKNSFLKIIRSSQLSKSQKRNFENKINLALFNLLKTYEQWKTCITEIRFNYHSNIEPISVNLWMFLSKTEFLKQITWILEILSNHQDNETWGLEINLLPQVIWIDIKFENIDQ